MYITQQAANANDTHITSSDVVKSSPPSLPTTRPPSPVEVQGQPLRVQSSVELTVLLHMQNRQFYTTVQLRINMDSQQQDTIVIIKIMSVKDIHRTIKKQDQTHVN